MEQQNTLQLGNLTADQNPMQQFISNQHVIDQYLQENNDLKNELLGKQGLITQKEEELRSTTSKLKTKVEVGQSEIFSLKNTIRELEVSRDLQLQSKQKFIEFVKQNILSQIEGSLDRGWIQKEI